MTARVVFRHDPVSPDARRVLVQRQGFLAADALASYREATAGTRFEPFSKKSGRKGGLNVATVDKLPGILKRLREAGMDVLVTPPVAEMLSRHEAAVWLDLQAAKQRLDAVAVEMKKKDKALYPAQRVGVEWLSTRHRGLLADQMGVGKTIQALCAIPANAPVLVICPAVVKGVWVREVGLWRSTLSPQILEGRKSFRFPKAGEMVITNFDILPVCHKEGCPKKIVVTCDGCSPVLPEGHKQDCKRGVTYCPGCAPMPVPEEGTVVICDEVHNCKNRGALRSESKRAISHAVLRRGGWSWDLTGTPVLNDPEELWSILESSDLAHEAFGSWKDFVRCLGGRVKTVETYDKRKRVKVTKQVGYEWGTPLPESVDRLQRVMLRRMLCDVAEGMPPLTRKLLPVDVNKAALKEFDKLFGQLGGAKGLQEILSQKKIPFELVSTVRSALARAKMPAMMAQVEQFEDSGEPLLVFSAHRAPIDLLQGREGWAVITGDTPAKERTQIEEAFQAGKYKGIGGTIVAAGVGITLTYGAHALFVDEEWTPALNDQAVRRLLRHGQKRPVFVDVLVANHPLDQRIAEILASKTAIIEGSVDAARETG